MGLVVGRAKRHVSTGTRMGFWRPEEMLLAELYELLEQEEGVTGRSVRVE